ncbi:interferon-induced, double-stranded RNA-activated protein kinase isoform X3 [Xenopus laevis]|uniref:non-specific serine/threonine protein kinase n=1 Tax=Xenopus laevis TaxID=8355 RepID=A0A8J1KMS9_XENLA|nr:interferon-induced, double-stranded RNA-activated protein kinase isoform X3 [Xenopus laevis]
MDPKVEFNVFCAKKKLIPEFRLISQTGPPHDPWFTVHLYVQNEMFGEGQGKSKKAAEKIAARIGLAALQNQGIPPQAQQPTAAASLDPVQSSLQGSAATAEPPVNGSESQTANHINYIGILNELCQKKSWNTNFRDVDRYGPDHEPKFYCVAEVNKQAYPEGCGRNKKQARKKAAFLALHALKTENPNDILIPAIPALYTGESGSESSSVSESNGSRSNDRWSLAGGTTQAMSAVPESTTNSSQSPSPFAGFVDISKLSSGGFGKVFKALKTLDNKYYAVKKVKMHNEKCKLEVEALANLDHPNIVRYFHSWTGMDYSSDTSYSSSSFSDTDGMNKCLYIQMEFCENGDLKNWIRKMKSVDKIKSLDIFRQIVEGVVYIHSEKRIHRDLKPENIFFAKEMRVKIGDLGLVTQMFSEDSTDALLRTNSTGTPTYMAPEQHENIYNSEVDIFALGLILVELLCIFGTGHERANEWKKLQSGQLPETFVEQFPYETHTVKKMLSTDPTKRPTAKQLKQFLETKNYLDSRTC